ncbi:MAG: VirE protein [Bacteroides sp.]|nr:VirE protein [Bacteroides sp.]
MFGIANNVKSEVRECTPELLNQALDSPKVAKTSAEIEDALEAFRRGELTQDEFETIKSALKKQLPILTLHALFKNGRRKNEDAIPSGLSIYDLDHIPNPRAKWAEIEARKEELGVLLAHITPSTEGLRLAFIVPQGMDLAQAQAWMARQLGDDKYDACVKDYARCSFLVPREYVLYMNEEKLFAPTIPLVKGVGGCSIGQGEESTEPTPATSPLPPSEGGGENNHGVHDAFPTSYEDIPYENIVETLEEQMGGQPEHGSRNNFIFSMACHLRYVCNDDAHWISQLLPTYGEAREKWLASIRSACNRNQTKTMPRIMKRTLAICRERMEAEEQAADPQGPPPMPVRLPPLIKLLVSKTPKIYRPAVAHAVFPALAAHLWKTTFRYIDNVEHEATLMNVLMAGTGAGKNCISDPINHILKDIRQRDRENLQREKEWKKEMQTKGANKDKRQRPEGLVIQEIDPDMTNAAFVQRLADAEERFLYARMNEIDQFDALKTSARSKAHFQIMCLAFDPGNVYGQTRVGTGSVSERVCIRFNWNASTTIHKGQSYFRSVLTDGPISRINFCTIPEQPIGSDMPVYGTYDAEFDEELRPYIERLNKARGLVECRGAKLLAKKLKEENAEFARLSQSRVYENLSFRANVIAFLKAMVLFVAQGGVWDKVTEEFIRWSLKYDMYCKMHFFGDEIEGIENAGMRVKKRGPQNLLDLLPDTFTRDDAQQMRRRQGITGGNLTSMLGMWRKRGYIEAHGPEVAPNEAGKQQFVKTRNYLRK